MVEPIIVHKCDHHSNPVLQYKGVILARTGNMIILEAYFQHDDYATPYHTFKRGDRFVEHFFNDRWYNIFAMHHCATGLLEGWYCNITRPARFESNTIYADDLALDIMVYPNGQTLVLDEDEFATLEIDSRTRQRANWGRRELLSLVAERWGPFSEIKPE